MRNQHRLIGISLAIAALAAGCSDDGKAVNEACESNDGCSSGICHRGVCAAKVAWGNSISCSGPGECRSSFCDEGFCAPGSGEEGSLCIYDEECAGGACSGGRCGEAPDGGGDGGDGGGDGGDGGVGDGGDGGGPDGACDNSQQCDDQLACTDDLCGDAGLCVFEVQPGNCAIAGACYSVDGKPEDNPCVKCDPDKDQQDWTADDEPSCDDEEVCTYDDACSGGTCKGTTYSCDDGLSCTNDTCNGQGPPVATGCEFEIRAGQCLIGGIFCYADGEPDPGNQCRHCDPIKSQTAWTVAPLSGCVTTLSTDFVEPQGVAIDGSGGVYVADAGSHQIKLYAQETVTVLVGSGAAGDVDGPPLSAELNGPSDVAVDATGKVYIADTENHKIRVIAGGTLKTLAGTGAAGSANGIVNVATFSRPVALALDGPRSLLYVIDASTHRIRKIDLGSALVTTLAGSSKGFADGAGTAAKFDTPTDLAVDGGGNIYVADSGNHRIRKIVGTTGVVTTLAGNGTAGYVNGIAGSGSVQFDTPTSLAIDGSGNLFIGDSLNYRIRRIDAAPPVVLSVAGDGTEGTDDGVAGAARLSQPRRLQFVGNEIYLVSPTSKALRVFIP